jgi:maltose O-acetyltransferase
LSEVDGEVYVRIVRILDAVAGLVPAANAKLSVARAERRLNRLRAEGLHIGEDVFLPDSTVFDTEYCQLIWISDSCSFGEHVMLIAHETQPHLGENFTRVGSIRLHRSCHLGARTMVLPGVTIGPRTIVAACSVVRTSLPPDSVCAGNPARPFSSLARYLDAHRTRLTMLPTFHVLEDDSAERRSAILVASRTGDAYIIGGRSAELSGTGGSRRTPTRHHTPVPPEARPPSLTP